MNSKRPSLLLYSAAVPLFAALTSAAAQETTQLQPIVVQADGTESAKGPDAGIVAQRSLAATKTDTSLLETPQAVSVVTRDEMAAQGVDMVAQALRYTPGVMAEPNGYDVRYDWLWVRGFDAYGTSWLDGLTLPGDSLNYATPSIDPYTLERVEVIKGPASVLYGRSVPGGLINLVSKRPQAIPHREAEIGTSLFGGIQGKIDMTGPITEDGDWLYRFVGTAENMGTQIDMERNRNFVLAPSLTWAPSDDTSLTLYGYYQRDRDIFSPRFYPAHGTLLPNPAGPIPDDLFMADPNAEEFNRDYYHLGYEFSHSFNENVTVRQNLRYGRSEQDMFLALVSPPFPFGWGGSPDNELERVAAASDDTLTAFTVDTSAEVKFATGNLDHTALFGIDYLRATSSTNFGNSMNGAVPPLDYLNPSYGYPVAVPAYTRSGYQKQDQVGIYAQDQIRYGNWIGTFGLRYDRSEIDTTDRMTAGSRTVSTDDQELTWRAGLTYVFDNGIAPYASYSTAFLPNFGTNRFGDPFEAQTAEQFEVGVKYEPLGGRGMFAVSLFDMTVENGLSPDPTDSTFDVQVGKQRVRGIEVEGKYELTSEISILASYAYSNSEVLESANATALGREMLRLPEHQGGVWVNYQPMRIPGLSLSAGVRATSSYQTDPTYLSELRIPARALVDLGLKYDLGAWREEFEGTNLRINVTNLFDKKYVPLCQSISSASCNFGARRAITASLKYTW